MDEVEIGKVTHFFGKAQVAVVSILNDAIKNGDAIRIQGHTSDFMQTVESMQIDHKPVESAEAGQEIAIKVKNRCHRNDKVFKVLE